MTKPLMIDPDTAEYLTTIREGCWLVDNDVAYEVSSNRSIRITKWESLYELVFVRYDDPEGPGQSYRFVYTETDQSKWPYGEPVQCTPVASYVPAA